MSDVEIIGRGIDFNSTYPSQPDVRKLQVFTLSQAASLSEIPIHELKEAIHDKRLVAGWYGRYMITFEDLVWFIEESQTPLSIPLKLMLYERSRK